MPRESSFLWIKLKGNLTCSSTQSAEESIWVQARCLCKLRNHGSKERNIVLRMILLRLAAMVDSLQKQYVGHCHCLTYIWYTRRFGSCLYSCRQVIGCHYNDTFFLFCQWKRSGSDNEKTCLFRDNQSPDDGRRAQPPKRRVYQMYLRQWTFSKVVFL
jgi:hypothetical protein